MTGGNKSWALPPELLPVTQVNTVEARVARRRAFRRQFDLAPEARGYVPAPYENRFVDDEPESPLAAALPGEDIGALLDFLQNGERAGAASSDPS